MSDQKITMFTCGKPPKKEKLTKYMCLDCGIKIEGREPYEEHKKQCKGKNKN